MSFLTTVIWSSVIKKFLNAIGGLALCGFIVVHLMGNMTLLFGSAQAFNSYSHFLLSMGGALYLAEGGIVLFFLIHMITGTAVWWDKQTARPQPYKKRGAAGPPSHMNVSSKNMIITGAVLLIFTVYHLITFKYGPGIAEGYVMNIDGVQVRDLYRLTMEVFSKPGYVIFYVVCMLLLWLHLRHGFWSAFQSLGINHPRYTPLITGFGMLFAIVMGFGFLILPVVIYFRGGAA